LKKVREKAPENDVISQIVSLVDSKKEDIPGLGLIGN